MIFGYIRVSKSTQNLNLQEDALRNFNCDKIFFEKESGVKFRKEWENLYTQLRSGDTVVIWKIDRLGRTSWEWGLKPNGTKTHVKDILPLQQAV